MFADLWFSVKMWVRFHAYRPQPVTPSSALRWLCQFDDSERAALRKAASRLTFVSEKKFIQDLLDRNKELLKKLQDDGVPLSNIIYISIGVAGSSSHATLNLVRDGALLQNHGCRFADGRSYESIHDLTNILESGVIIYVDDFAGTGEQFCKAQDKLASYIRGSFSQYYLLHTACEEAIQKIDGIGVVPWQYAIHEKCVRPLHANSTILSSEERECLTRLCLRIRNGKLDPLGHGAIAASIVFYQNTPDNVPCVFRGDKHQQNFFGLVPRTTDLPTPSLA